MLLYSISIILSICKPLNMKNMNMNMNNFKEKTDNIEWLTKNNNIEDIFYILYIPNYINNSEVLNDEIKKIKTNVRWLKFN